MIDLDYFNLTTSSLLEGVVVERLVKHGSKDSLDIDVYAIVNKPIEDRLVSQRLCNALSNTLPGLNPNPIFIENGVATWVYKGTVDECNNSLLATYGLHAENTGVCPISAKLSRDVPLKVSRTIRGLLSYISRIETVPRPLVKEALRSEDMSLKLSVLKQVHLPSIPSFPKKGSNEDVYKFFAFQLAQTCALLDGKELFTKSDCSFNYPELSIYLNRKVQDSSHTFELQKYLGYFLKRVESVII